MLTVSNGNGEIVTHSDRDFLSQGNLYIKSKAKNRNAEPQTSIFFSFQPYLLEYTLSQSRSLSTFRHTLLLKDQDGGMSPVDTTACVYHGAVLDDYGAPFLHFRTVFDVDKPHPKAMEFVMKLTRENDQALTLNEKLRLGYRIEEDLNETIDREPDRTNDKDLCDSAEDNVQELLKALKAHTSAAADIIEKITKIRSSLDDELGSARSQLQRAIEMTPASTEEDGSAGVRSSKRKRIEA